MEPSLVEELRPGFAGRKVVLTGGPLAALTGTCRRVRELGRNGRSCLPRGLATQATEELPVVFVRLALDPGGPHEQQRRAPGDGGASLDGGPVR